MSTNHPKENGWFVSKQHSPRIQDRKTPITEIKMKISKNSQIQQ